MSVGGWLAVSANYCYGNTILTFQVVHTFSKGLNQSWFRSEKRNTRYFKECRHLGVYKNTRKTRKDFNLRLQKFLEHHKTEPAIEILLLSYHGTLEFVDTKWQPNLGTGDLSLKPLQSAQISIRPHRAIYWALKYGHYIHWNCSNT